mgnify:CR=1 FL=1
MSYISDNPIADFNRWDAEQEKALESLPKCDICHEPIQEEHYYKIDGKNWCETCVDDCREWV